MKTAYTVRCERDETGWWVATVPDVPGAITQARRLDQIGPRIREAIDLVLDRDGTDYEVAIVPTLSGDTSSALERLDAAHNQVAAATAEQRAAAAAAAHQLVDVDGLTLRDAAAVLGVSFQRVAQLREAAAGARPGQARRSRRRAS